MGGRDNLAIGMPNYSIVKIIGDVSVEAVVVKFLTWARTNETNDVYKSV
jgi:hypothetical protein